MDAAVWSLSKSLAKTHGKDGIWLTIVCPGLFDTEVNDHIRDLRAEQNGVPPEDAIYTHLSSDPTWGCGSRANGAVGPTKRAGLLEYPVRDLNPCYHLERVAS